MCGTTQVTAKTVDSGDNEGGTADKLSTKFGLCVTAAFVHGVARYFLYFVSDSKEPILTCCTYSVCGASVMSA